MKTTFATSKTVDEYIKGFAHDVQARLNNIRTTIRHAAPDAEESISYRIPTFKLGGRPLIYFAAFKAHIGLYPMTETTRETFKKELSRYEGGKGTAKLPFDKPVPYALISRIVKYRAQEIGTSRSTGGEKRGVRESRGKHETQKGERT